MTETRTSTESAALDSGICAREGCSSEAMSKARTPSSGLSHQPRVSLLSLSLSLCETRAVFS